MSWRKKPREVYVDINFEKLEEKGIGAMFPNIYEIGIANLGHQRVLKEIADRKVYPHRFYGRDRSLGGEKLEEIGLLFVSISYEVDYLNLVEVLERSGSGADRRDRANPVVVVGGIFPTYNPAPFYYLADAVVIGDGEEIIGRLVETFLKVGKDKKSFLRRIDQIPWIWVPERSELRVKDGYLEGYRGKVPKRRVYRRPTGRYYVVPDGKDIYYKERVFAIEVERGCGGICSFCVFSHSNKPHRVRSLREVEELVKKGKRAGVERIKLFYELLPRVYHRRLLEIVEKHYNDVKFGFGGIRADMVDTATVKVLKKSQNSITLAPETSETIRYYINKNLPDKEFYRALSLAREAGIDKYGYYLIVGFPGENERSIEELARFLAKSWGVINSKGGSKLFEIHINPFFPKPNTPLQYWRQITPEEASYRIDLLVEKFEKYSGDSAALDSVNLTGGAGIDDIEAEEGVIFRTIAGTYHHYIQPIIARGGPEVLEYAKEGIGRSVAYWKKLYNSEIGEKAFGARKINKRLPWEFVQSGFYHRYFREAYLGKREGKDCLSGCRDCGVCQILLR